MATASPATTAERPPVGAMLRDWRQRRRLSQLDLALEAGVSTRHLSFVETGRSKPSREMVLRLAEQLEVPLRERNGLLLAAGYAPVYAERDARRPRDGAGARRRSSGCSTATSRTRRWSSTATGTWSPRNRGVALLTERRCRRPAAAAGQRAAR